VLGIKLVFNVVEREMGLNFIKYYSVSIFVEKFSSGTLELSEFKEKFDPKNTILLNANGATRELFLEYPIGRMSGEAPKTFQEFKDFFKGLPLRKSDKTTVANGLIAKELAFGTYGTEEPYGKFWNLNRQMLDPRKITDPTLRWEENMYVIYTCRESFVPELVPKFGMRVTLRQYTLLSLIFMNVSRKTWREPIRLQDLGQFPITRDNFIKVLKVSPVYREMPEEDILAALKLPLKDTYLIGTDSSVLI